MVLIRDMVDLLSAVDSPKQLLKKSAHKCINSVDMVDLLSAVDSLKQLLKSLHTSASIVLIWWTC